MAGTDKQVVVLNVMYLHSGEIDVISMYLMYGAGIKRLQFGLRK